MPELPEVETIRRSLEPKLCGQTIEQVEVFHNDVLINQYQMPLTGWIVSGLRRRGKYLLIDAERAEPWREFLHGSQESIPANAQTQPLSDDCIDRATIVIHLRMTGQLLLDEVGDLERDHVHVRFSFNGLRLLFRDVRRFGRIWFLPGGQEMLQSGLAALGPEPLGEDWTLKGFRQALARHSKANIKSVLLNQHVVAGLGNIYVDEALFRAGISPLQTASAIGAAKARVLYDAVRVVLDAAIGHRGTSFRDYVDGLNTRGHFQYELMVYGRGGEPCRICGHTLVKRRVAGRGTCSCLHCQPDPISIPGK